MDVSVILVNYNTLSLTMSCIDSIFLHTQDIDFEVIVVDNDSHDGSQDILAADSRILFIESGSNLGFGRANNLGMLSLIHIYYSEEAICMNSAPLARGEKVRVIKGPLTGLVGELVTVDGRSKIAVRLNMLGCACADMPVDVYKRQGSRHGPPGGRYNRK